MKRTVASSHNDWLTLVEPVGSFLTLPVLKRAFPNGIPVVERDVRSEVRLRLDALTSDVSDRTGWLQWVLRELLGLEGRLRESAGVPPTLTHRVAEQSVELRPDFAVMEPAPDGPGTARLLVFRWPVRTPLDRRPAHDANGLPTRWAATPIERAAIACRAVNVPLALVTDTDRFAIVWAPRAAPGGHAIWSSALFSEEQALLDSFVALLGMGRFFGVAEDATLAALLAESGQAQAEVTDRLGHQVREAVELLVGAFSRAHRASGQALMKGVSPQEVYNAAVTVMMRLVVLLAAEERRLLPADDELYVESYSVIALRDQLENVANRDGLETLEKRHTAWHRLLATFRAVYGGIQHDRLRLPAYGGSLFDPGRFAFLEHPAPLPVDDHTVLAILSALQILTFRQGGVTEARRLSYRNLDVEQIGHVYEGLLDHGCRRVEDQIVLGLIGRRGEEPEIALDTLQTALDKGEEDFAAWLRERGGPPPARTLKLLYEEREGDADHRLLAACDNDDEIYKRVRPFAGLLREDLRRLPTVILPGALYVTQTSERRDSGTAYTTKELADEVVRYALEPLVFSPGPSEGANPADWKLKSSTEILKLKVCDPAVGSGAILVAACRYLADRLVEAWQIEGAHVPQGFSPAAVTAVHPSETLLLDSDWTLEARRRITDHCLYGVDRNPMAVEMAKLSLWLTTMARERPFTFLDHQVRCGDSLLGINSLDQVRWFHIDPARGRELHSKRPLFDPTRAIDPRVELALEKARSLDGVNAVTMRDVETQRRLHGEIVDALAPLGVVANAAVGAALATPARGYRPPWWPTNEDTPTTDDLLEEISGEVETAFTEAADSDAASRALADLREKAAFWLDTDRPDGAPDRVCLHWPLAFPEVFLAPGRSGFDAFVGNPPFLGGQRITGAMGTAFRTFLVEHVAGGRRGSADLVAYFYLRAYELLNDGGTFGFLATNTIAQGDTRDVGLDQLVCRGATIVRAVPSEPWPGAAALEIAKVWLRKGSWQGDRVLSGEIVRGISAFLAIPRRVEGTPYRLKANENRSFQGSIVLGMGFVMTPEEAQQLIARDPRNRDVLFPYLNGEDLNSRWDQSPSRWVINFRNWPLDRNADGTWHTLDEDHKTDWLRLGSVPSDYPGQVASDYPECLDIVRLKVKPERDRLADGDATARDRARRWWQFGRPTMLLYSTIAALDRVMVTARVSKHLIIVPVVTGGVASEATVVFASSDYGMFGLLSSSIHDLWARLHSSTLETRLRYTPSDCFETFPLPAPSRELVDVAERYDSHRRSILTECADGLTKLYNRFHSADEQSADIVRLRELHIEIDHAVAHAYPWATIPLEHGFHETRQGIRFTVSPSARQDLLDRLLELNHERYAEEVARGLHERDGQTNAKTARTTVGRSAKRRAPTAERQAGPSGDLFEEKE